MDKNQVGSIFIDHFKYTFLDYITIQEVSIPTVYEPTYTDVETAVLSVCNFDPQIPVTLPISLEDLNTHVTSCHSNGFESQYAVNNT